MSTKLMGLDHQPSAPVSMAITTMGVAHIAARFVAVVPAVVIIITVAAAIVFRNHRADND